MRVQTVALVAAGGKTVSSPLTVIVTEDDRELNGEKL